MGKPGKGCRKQFTCENNLSTMCSYKLPLKRSLEIYIFYFIYYFLSKKVN